MTTADMLNDLFQQARDAQTARALLDAITVRQLRALADLNHLDAEGGRARLTHELMTDRIGQW